MNLSQGKRYPWLLTLPQTYLCTGVVFLGTVAVLVALIVGASQNREALESLAREVELQAPPIAPEPPEPAPEPVRAGAGAFSERQGTTEKALRVSAPDEWQWSGCRMPDSTGAVEILFSARGRPE